MDGRRVVRTGLDAALRAHHRAGAVSLATAAVDDGSATVVLAAPRDEYHDGGRRLAGAMLPFAPGDRGLRCWSGVLHLDLDAASMRGRFDERRRGR